VLDSNRRTHRLSDLPRRSHRPSLSGWESSFDFLIPIFSMAIEIACAAVLVVHIRGITKRMASTAALLNT